MTISGPRNTINVHKLLADAASQPVPTKCQRSASAGSWRYLFVQPSWKILNSPRHRDTYAIHRGSHLSGAATQRVAISRAAPYRPANTTAAHPANAHDAARPIASFHLVPNNGWNELRYIQCEYEWDHINPQITESRYAATIHIAHRVTARRRATS